MYWHLVIMLFLFHLKQGRANQRIIGGQNPEGNVSWGVYLCRDGSILRPLGTGAIISPYHVITSARNMLDNVTNEVLIDTMVIGGVFDVEDFKYSQVRKVVKVYFPEKEDPDLYAQICILKMNHRFTITTTVSMGILPSIEDTRPDTRTICDFYGWGYSNEKKLPKNRARDKLLKSTMQIVNSGRCMREWEHVIMNYKSSQSVICTALPSAPPCQFDVGGPLMCRPPQRSEKVLTGILDHPSPNCKKFDLKSSLFMNIFHFLPWIHEMLKKDNCGFIANTPRCPKAGSEEIEEEEEADSEVSTVVVRAEDNDKANSPHQAHLAFKLIEIYAFLLLLQ